MVLSIGAVRYFCGDDVSNKHNHEVGGHGNVCLCLPGVCYEMIAL